MPKRYGKRHLVFEKIVRQYEAAPAVGNGTDEMLRRTEYVLALQMLAIKDEGDARMRVETRKTIKCFHDAGAMSNEDFAQAMAYIEEWGD
jgi:hypothetical protein